MHNSQKTPNKKQAYWFDFERLWLVKVSVGSRVVVTSSSKCCLVKGMPTRIVLGFRLSKCYHLPRCLIIVKHLMVSGDGFRLAVSGFDRKRVEPLLIGRQTAAPFCSAFTCHHSIKCQHISHKFWVFLPAQQKSKYTTQLVHHMFLKIQYFPTFQQIPTKKAKENRKPRSNHHQKLAQSGKTTLTPGTVSFGRVGLAVRWRSHLRWG